MPMTSCFLEWKRNQPTEEPMGYCHDFPTLDRILQYEEGELDDDGIIELFQYLVDSGLAWTLQGRYGREAMRFIEEGHVTVGPMAQPAQGRA